MGFSREGYWSGLSRPPQGYLPYSGTEPASPAVLTLTLTQGSLGSWMMAQRKHPGPNPWNVRMVVGKMDFAGVIQIRMLR